MRNILAYVSQRDKAAFAASLKLIWQAGDKKAAREQVESLRDRYETKYPKVIGIFPNPDAYVRLVSIYLMEYSEDWSVSKAYLSELSIEAIPKLAA